jgi:hypothetical protein
MPGPSAFWREDSKGTNEKGKPQGLKPLILRAFNAWAKAQAYLRSKNKDSDVFGLSPVLAQKQNKDSDGSGLSRCLSPPSPPQKQKQRQKEIPVG